MEKKATIIYNLTEGGRKANLLAGGDGKRRQEVLADITPELLELAHVGTDGEVVLDLTQNRPNTAKLHTGWNPGIELRCMVGGHDLNPGQAADFPAPLTAEQLIAWEKARVTNLDAQIKELEPLAERAKANYEAKERAREEKQAKEKAERAKQEAKEREAEKVAKEAALKERAEWIAAHGSDYLKRATALEYNCQRQYVIERAAFEHPDYVVDFDDNARWKDRACPSIEALEEVEKLVASGLDAKVVWLTHPADCAEIDTDEYDPYEHYEHEEWEAREAIVIRSYLDKYDLVKEY